MISLLNEKQLLLQLARGNEEAFKKIYDFYSPKYYFKILRILKSQIDTEEVLQNVFLKLWKNRAIIDADRSFNAYLSCIAVNSCYDFFRKMSRDNKLKIHALKHFAEKINSGEEALINKENSKLLSQAINSLPEKRKQVFMLCKIDGKTYSEISRLLGISTSTISDHIVKANFFLRTYLLRAII